MFSTLTRISNRNTLFMIMNSLCITLRRQVRNIFTLPHVLVIIVPHHVNALF